MNGKFFELPLEKQEQIIKAAYVVQAGMLVCAVYDKYSARYTVQMEQAADLYIAYFRDAPLPDAEFEDGNEKG